MLKFRNAKRLAFLLTLTGALAIGAAFTGEPAADRTTGLNHQSAGQMTLAETPAFFSTPLYAAPDPSDGKKKDKPKKKRPKTPK